MNDRLDKLAFSFFKLFARYEYFLKENGFFQVSGSGQIIVDWDRFVNTMIGPDYLKQLGNEAESVEFILATPPNKQVVNSEKRIIWDEVSNQERSVQILFSHISRIRNNLYHGAKFNDTWFDPQRSEELLRHGLIVLEHFKGLASIE